VKNFSKGIGRRPSAPVTFTLAPGADAVAQVPQDLGPPVSGQAAHLVEAAYGGGDGVLDLPVAGYVDPRNGLAAVRAA
jgi:hypothetical protein